MNRQINVVVANHHPVVRRSVRKTPGHQDEITVDGTTNNSSDAAELLSRVPCDALSPTTRCRRAIPM